MARPCESQEFSVKHLSSPVHYNLITIMICVTCCRLHVILKPGSCTFGCDNCTQTPSQQVQHEALDNPNDSSAVAEYCMYKCTRCWDPVAANASQPWQGVAAASASTMPLTSDKCVTRWSKKHQTRDHKDNINSQVSMVCLLVYTSSRPIYQASGC